MTEQEYLELERDGKLNPKQLQILEEGRKNGLIGQPLQVNDSIGRQALDFAQKTGDTAAMGFGNQIGGGITAAAKWIGKEALGQNPDTSDLQKDYESARNAGMQEENRFDKQHPYLSTTASILGGIAPAILESPIAELASTKVIPSAIKGIAPYVGAAGQGAVDSSLYGASNILKDEDISGEEKKDPFQNLPTNALVGAIAGPFAEGLGKIAPLPFNVILNAAKKAIGKDDNVLASKYLTSTLGGNVGKSDRLEEEINNADTSEPYMFADFLGSLGTKALQGLKLNSKLEDQAILEDSIRQRDQEIPTMLSKLAQKHFGDYSGGNPNGISQEGLSDLLKQKRKDLTDIPYKKSYSDMSFLPSGKLQDALQDPDYASYISQGEANQARRNKPLLQSDIPPSPVNPYMVQLHSIIKGLNEDIDKQSNKMSSAYSPEQASTKIMEKNAINDELRKQSPQFMQAQTDYAKMSHAIDLLDDNKNLLTQHPSDVSNLLNNEEMRQAAKMKVASDIQKMLGTASQNANLINKPIFSSGNARANIMQTASDPEGLIKSLNSIQRFKKTSQDLLGGSQTAEKQSAWHNMGSLLGAITHPVGAISHVAGMFANPSQEVLQDAAKRLTSTDRGTALETLNAIRNENSPTPLEVALSNAIKNKTSQEGGKLNG